jgi:beta-glucanase (GH16 family)
MKALITAIASSCVLLSCASHSRPEPSGWKLAWADEFNGTALDTTVWSKTARGKAHWADTQSKDARCYDLRDGKLILRGIVNDDLATDTARYLTGGIWTKHKKAFTPGRIEVRAKLNAATGAWPAIWMLPYYAERYEWPAGGEIDLMERLNHDEFVYQTVHSTYTYTLDRKTDPKSSITPAINPNEFNTYGVDVYPDSVVFHINGTRTGCYPRINNGADGQFPFYKPMFLIIDMQLGGTWVGPVDPAQLPVEMEVDWVRYYQRQ